MTIISKDVDTYIEQFSKIDNELLQLVLHETNAIHPHAHMMSSEVQGKFLTMLCKLTNPSNVLEIGTFTGFSALCIAEGINENSSIHTIELREEDAKTAQKYFDKSAHSKKIKLHIGNALEIIPTLKIEWDFIFIDADKTGYIDYYELTLPALKAGGYILADNVLFHGEVLQKHISGKNAKAIHEFNKTVAADSRVEQVMLSIRDGLLLIRKK